LEGKKFRKLEDWRIVDVEMIGMAEINLTENEIEEVVCGVKLAGIGLINN
jgi:hypothetical protein